MSENKKLEKMIRLRPRGFRLLVVMDGAKEKAAEDSMIIIPETAKKDSTFGTVVDLGQPAKESDGKEKDWPAQIGQRVLVKKYGGTELKIDGMEKVTKIFEAEDILAVLEEVLQVNLAGVPKG